MSQLQFCYSFILVEYKHRGIGRATTVMLREELEPKVNFLSFFYRRLSHLDGGAEQTYATLVYHRRELGAEPSAFVIF